MSDINITFVNTSNDTNHSGYVIFQHNTAPDYNTPAIAWQVIKNTGRGYHHPFPYSFEYYISAGNTSMQLLAQHNTLYEVFDHNGTTVIEAKGEQSEAKKGFTLANELPNEIVSADLYNSGSLISSVPHLAPQQKVTFETQPHELCIAAVNFPIETGEHLPEGFLQNKENYTILNVEKADGKAIICATDENGKVVFTIDEIPEEEGETAAAE